MKVIFNEKIGELYDVLQALTIYFSHKNDEEEEETEDVSKYLGDVDEHIALFFEPKKKNKIFMLHELFPALLSQIGPCATQQDFYKFLEPQRLKRWLFHFYTGETYSDNLASVAGCIANHEMSVRLKYQLLSFCTDPQPAIQCLINEIERILHATSGYRFYCENRLKLRRNEITCQESKTFIHMLKNMGDHVIRWNERKELYVSFCVLNRRIIECQIVCPLVLLGIEYQETLEELNIRREYDLFEVMKALSAPLRGKVIKKLQVSRGNVSLSALSSHVGETTTNLKYQMSVLEKSGLVHMKHIKNQLCYELNHECCDYAVRNLERLLKHDTELLVQEKCRGEGSLWWNEGKSIKRTT